MENVLISELSIPNDDTYCAKIDELKKWKENVCEPVKFIGQNTTSTRWVVTEKYINGEKRTKARLVARGFEGQNSEVQRKRLSSLYKRKSSISTVDYIN